MASTIFQFYLCCSICYVVLSAVFMTVVIIGAELMPTVEGIVLLAIGISLVLSTLIAAVVVVLRCGPKNQPENQGHEMAALNNVGDNPDQEEVFLAPVDGLFPNGRFLHQAHQGG